MDTSRALIDVPHSIWGMPEILRKLAINREVFCFDLDGTLDTGDEFPSERELKARKEAIELADERGLVVFLSARTPEIMMKGAALRASQAMGMDRLEPHCQKDANGRFTYASLETIPRFEYLYNPDIIGSLGVGFLGSWAGGYVYDRGFDRWLVEGSPGTTFREAAFALLKELYPGGEIFNAMAPIEYEENYRAGRCDVAPIPYRIQFDFYGERAIAHKLEFMRRRREAAGKGNRLAMDMVIVDESKPNEHHPERGRSTAYLMPYWATKEYMVQYLVNELSKASGIKAQSLRVYYAGDTLTDFRAMCYGGADAQMFSCLATGSRLFNYIWDEVENLVRGKDFAGEKLYYLSGHRIIQNARQTGHLKYKVPFIQRERDIVIGNLAYPDLSAPESVLEFLKWAVAQGAGSQF